MADETIKVLPGKEPAKDLQRDNIRNGPASMPPGLIPYQPGVSGNPAGRPKGAKTGIRAQLKRLLESKGKEAVILRLQEEGIDIGKEASASSVIAGVLVDQGQDGDQKAIDMMLEQTEIPLPRNVKIDSTVEIHTIQRVMIDINDTNPNPVLDAEQAERGGASAHDRALGDKGKPKVY